MEDGKGVGYLLGRLKALSLLRSNRSSRNQWLPTSMLMDGPGGVREELWPKQRDRLQDRVVLLPPVPPLCLLSRLPVASGGFLVRTYADAVRGGVRQCFPSAAISEPLGTEVPTSEYPKALGVSLS